MTTHKKTEKKTRPLIHRVIYSLNYDGDTLEPDCSEFMWRNFPGRWVLSGTEFGSRIYSLFFQVKKSQLKNSGIDLIGPF